MTWGGRVTLTCPACQHELTADVSVTVDAGCRTFPNGDPGYPGSTEIEWRDLPEHCPECGVAWSDATLQGFDDVAGERAETDMDDAEHYAGDDRDDLTDR